MLLLLAKYAHWFGPLRLFESITFRAVVGVGLAFLASMVLGPRFIRRMRRANGTEDVDKPDSATLQNLHAAKKGTPTMGGLVLIGAVMLAILLAGDPANPLIWIGQGVLGGFALLGFLDDYAKLKNWGGRRGLSKIQKIAGQTALALAAALALAYAADYGGLTIVDAKPLAELAGIDGHGVVPADAPLLAALTLAPDVYYNWLRQDETVRNAAAVGDIDFGNPADDGNAGENGNAAAKAVNRLPATMLVIPLTKWSLVRPDLGWAYWLLAVLVIVACSNAVNLTDGLDGLATGCSLMVAVTYTILAYVVGNVVMCQYFRIPHVVQAGELTVAGAALAGGLMGFLWFNAHPARMFMGDTGSLALGAFVGYLAVATKHEIVLILAGGVFVLEAASVLLQVAGFKLTRRRLFRCAPFHHHLEFGGWAENHVVVRLWIVGALLAAAALGTLKLH